MHVLCSITVDFMLFIGISRWCIYGSDRIKVNGDKFGVGEMSKALIYLGANYKVYNNLNSSLQCLNANIIWSVLYVGWMQQ